MKSLIILVSVLLFSSGAYAQLSSSSGWSLGDYGSENAHSGVITSISEDNKNIVIVTTYEKADNRPLGASGWTMGDYGYNKVNTPFVTTGSDADQIKKSIQMNATDYINSFPLSPSVKANLTSMLQMEL